MTSPSRLVRYAELILHRAESINALQIEFLKYLQARYHWAHWEGALSGPSLVNIYEFFVDHNLLDNQAAKPSLEIQAAFELADKAAVISQFAIEKKDTVAEQAPDLFTQIYGGQAGNFALLGMATGGVYVAGGIAPKIIKKLIDGTFMHAFLDKDARYQELLKAMPVKVIINGNVGLMGATLAAAKLLHY